MKRPLLTGTHATSAGGESRADWQSLQSRALKDLATPDKPRAIPPSQVNPGPRAPRSKLLAPRWWLTAVAVVTAGLALYYLNKPQSPREPGSIAFTRTVEVRSGTLEQSIRLTGSLAAANSVLLRAPYLRGRRSAGGSGDFGLVLEELAPPGKEVRKGDVVAAFDNLLMMNRLDDFRAARLESETDLKTIGAQLSVRHAARANEIRRAKARMDRAALDLKTAAVRSAIRAALFQLEFEEAKAAYAALLDQTRYLDQVERSERRLAELAVRESQVEERRAESNVERMVVRAPAGGLVVVSETIRGSELSQIQAGDRLRPGQPYAQIVDARSMVVEARANQADVERLRIGDPAHVRFEAFDDLELPARIYSIAPLATGRRWRTNYVSEVPVFLKLDRVDSRLIPNLTVSADVILERESSESIIPREAVHYGEDDRRAIAFVRTPSGWEKRELELGIANNIEIAVSSGLLPGEVIALRER